MKNYEKMMETVKAIQEAFGANEFTRKDYEAKVEPNYSVYCSATVFKNKRYTKNPLERSAYIVKVARTEDFVAKGEDGKKYVGTRYFYEVNDNFMNDLKADLKNEIQCLKDSIDYDLRKISEKQARIEEKQNMLAVFEEIVK